MGGWYVNSDISSPFGASPNASSPDGQPSVTELHVPGRSVLATIRRNTESIAGMVSEAACTVFSISRYPSSTIGHYIRKARLEKGLRRVDVAAAIGVQGMTIVNWERHATVPFTASIRA